MIAISCIATVVLGHVDKVSNPVKELKRQEKILDEKIAQAIEEMTLRKTDIMNVIKKDPKKFSASDIQLKVVIGKGPSRSKDMIPNYPTEGFDLEDLLTSKRPSISPRWPPLVTHNLPQASFRSKNTAMGTTPKRIRRNAESHDGFAHRKVSNGNLILTPRRQRTEDLIYGRGKIVGGEKGRALPIQYQECKSKLQNRLIQSIKHYDT